jgi:hypothetical protein
LSAETREALRTRVFLRAVLPLLEVIEAERPPARIQARVQIAVAESGEGAALCWREGRFSVEQGVSGAAEVCCTFRDRAALNRFFAGRPSLPRIAGLRRPRLLLRALRLLASLRILQPGPAPDRRDERARRVRLLLYLVTRAMAELYRGGHPEMVELVDRSPERVYQWTVENPSIGAYLRMAPGRVKAGRGRYAARRPFVCFRFADVDDAFAVLTATGSQMAGVRSGALIAEGSPEYVRKIGAMMQKVDALLREG